MPEPVTLIGNPAAGRGQRFAAAVPRLLEVLAQHGRTARILETTAAPDSAGQLAREAAGAAGLVIACGGDGTVHGVLQGVAQSPATLGVRPFGTANALARNLQLPIDPVAALRKLMTYQPARIPLGQAVTAGGTRWFTVLAGAGPDGMLVHAMAASTKARYGRSAYYAKAGGLFLTRRFPAFTVEYRSAVSASWTRSSAVGMLASRVPDLGGLFSGLTPGARIHHPHLHVQLLTSPALLSLPAWFLSSRLPVKAPWLLTLDVEEIRCSAQSNSPPLVQIDGEPFGSLPLTLRMVPNALRLLAPAGLADPLQGIAPT